MRWSEAKFFLTVFTVAACGGGVGTLAVRHHQSAQELPFPPPRLTTVSPEQMVAIVGEGNDSRFALVEFMDYQCPPCRATQPKIRELLQHYPRINFVVRNMPLPMHPNAVPAATAAEAAREQNKFDPMHDSLLAGGSLAEPEIKQIAQKIGLNAKPFEEARQKSARRRVDTDVKIAATLHINATPSFLFCSVRERKVWQLSNFDQIKDLVK